MGTLVLAGAAPIVSADTQEIFTCSKPNIPAASAGSTSALGGPYVPVADAAVELNTGLLVYKECVLRVIVDRQKEAATSQIDRTVVNTYNNGNDGQPYYSTEIGRESLAIQDQRRLQNLQGGTLSPLNNAVEGTVRQALARSYTTQRDPTNAFACNYRGNLKSAYKGTIVTDYWTGFSALVDNPACNPYGAYTVSENALARDESYEIYKNMQRLSWAQGTYDKYTVDENGMRITQTPGAVILANGIMSIQSGYRQLQAANDIGQMVGALYAGVANQVLSGNGGLAGITQSSGGQPSYLDQVVANSGRGLITTVNNAALSSLQAALQTERQYNTLVTSMANLLGQTIGSLRARETQCFDLIVEAVCTSGSVQGESCTSKTGGQLTIKRTTGFSQKIIEASIRALATATANNLSASNSIVAKIQQLITVLSASPSSSTAASAALAALAALQPHSSSDVSRAQQDQQSMQTSMANILSKATTDWGDSTDPKVGWCNVNNAEVVKAWDSCWKGNSASCITP